LDKDHLLKVATLYGGIRAFMTPENQEIMDSALYKVEHDEPLDTEELYMYRTLGRHV